MSRIFVASDDEASRVEITQDDETGAHSAVCAECGRDLVADTHEQWSLEDTIEAASIHVDQLQRGAAVAVRRVRLPGAARGALDAHGGRVGGR